MKHEKIITLILILLSLDYAALSQGTVVPTEPSELCPELNTTFVVTLPLTAANTTISVSAFTGNPTLVNGVANVVRNTNNSTTSFTFVGRFIDRNIKQVFRVKYFANSNATSEITRDFEFTGIKSLFAQPTIGTPVCPAIQPNQPVVTAPICTATNIPISFSNIKWFNSDLNSCFGTIIDYEYQLPVGWKIGTTFTSTGLNWYRGVNNVTVTSNLLGGVAL